MLSTFAVRTDATEAGDSDQTVIQVRETTVALAVDGFGEVNFPTKAVGQGQFGANAPGVLTVKEGPLLTFGSVQAGAYEALELGDVPENESSQPEAIGPGISCTELVEEKQTAAALITGYAKIHGVADVRSELNGVVALRARPVVYKLELLFAFGQWAIATSGVQTIAKGEGAAVVIAQLAVHAAIVAVVLEQEARETACSRRAGLSQVRS